MALLYWLSYSDSVVLSTRFNDVGTDRSVKYEYLTAANRCSVKHRLRFTVINDPYLAGTVTLLAG